MAHEINAGHDKFGEDRSKGKRAWHGIGDDIGEGLSASDGFIKIGIDWDTYIAPLKAELPDGSMIEVPDWNAHVRADNQFVLGMVSSGYTPFQNMELAALADSLAGADKAVTVETCGTLYKGRRVFALVKLPHEIRVGKTGQDVMKQYVLVTNGHGGAFPTAVYPTSVRVVCANTLRWSERDVAQGVSFRHTGNFDEKVSQCRLMLGTAIEESKKFEEKVMALANTPLSKDQTRYFLRKMFEDIFGKPTALADAEVVERYEAKKAKIIEQWVANLEHEQQVMDGIAGTAWAAYNAVSMYSDHQRGRFKPIAESDARVAANLFGVSLQEKRKAFKRAMSYVK